MKHRIVLIVLAVSVSVHADTLMLGEFDLSMNKKDVLTKLGRPTEQIEQADLITDIFKYNDLEFYFSDENLIGAYSDSVGVCASDNVCVGSEVDDAHKAWGKSYAKTMQGKEYIEFYTSGEFGCWYRIGGIKKIESIEIACQP